MATKKKRPRKADAKHAPATRKQTGARAAKAAPTPEKRRVGRPPKNAIALDANTAVGMLAADHRKVEQLFARYEQSQDNDEKYDIARQACTALVIHALIEEEIFYPASRAALKDADKLDEAQVEHDTIKILIDAIMTSEPEMPFYDSKVKVLAEYVAHHVREEEQRANSIFARVLKTDLDVDRLADEMKAFRKELESRAKQGRLPKPRTQSFGRVAPRRVDESAANNAGMHR